MQTTEKQFISKSELLVLARQMMQEHDDYQEDMTLEDVEEKSGVLVFKGEYFLDENGLPTSQTTAVFNIYKALAHAFSGSYTLEKK